MDQEPAKPNFFGLASPLDAARSGQPLWHVQFEATVNNAPITDMLEGRQYPLAASGDELYAFTLPEAHQ
jgi:hypothetical protein